MANATPSENARLGGQMGALKAIDMSEINEPSGTQAKQPRVVHPRGQRPKEVPVYQRTFARPGRLFAPPVPAVRHVMLATTGAAIIFFVAGGRFDRIIAKVRGQEAPQAIGSVAGETFGTIMGWGVMLMILVFMADTGVMAPLAIGFSWLIFFMVLLEFGPKAADNIMGLLPGPDPVDRVQDISPGALGERIRGISPGALLPSSVPNTAMGQ